MITVKETSTEHAPGMEMKNAYEKQEMLDLLISTLTIWGFGRLEQNFNAFYDISCPMAVRIRSVSKVSLAFEERVLRDGIYYEIRVSLPLICIVSLVLPGI